MCCNKPVSRGHSSILSRDDINRIKIHNHNQSIRRMLMVNHFWQPVEFMLWRWSCSLCIQFIILYFVFYIWKQNDWWSIMVETSRWLMVDHGWLSVEFMCLTIFMFVLYPIYHFVFGILYRNPTTNAYICICVHNWHKEYYIFGVFHHPDYIYMVIFTHMGLGLYGHILYIKLDPEKMAIWDGIWGCNTSMDQWDYISFLTWFLY
jgi:hypothetical protein